MNEPCKVDGCENVRAQQFGKYGGLCAEHVAERRGVVTAAEYREAHTPDAADNGSSLTDELRDRGHNVSEAWEHSELVLAAKDVDAALLELARAKAALLALVDETR